MFTSSKIRHPGDSFSKHRAGKSSTSAYKVKRSFKEVPSSSSSNRNQHHHHGPSHLDLASSKQFEQATFRHGSQYQTAAAAANLNQYSAVTTISIGDPSSITPRLFAAHEDVLKVSPYLATMLTTAFYDHNEKKLSLPEESPEVFAAVLEFLYKGDYYPKLEYDSRRKAWSLENAAISPGNADSTVFIPFPSSNAQHAYTYPPYASPNSTTSLAGVYVLKDTAVYCTAERYGLPQLKRLALRKQGLQAGIPVSTILSSARFAYANTPESDSKLRAHYLALIIRSRNTFKRSGTMQAEMSMAGPPYSSPASPVIGSAASVHSGLPSPIVDGGVAQGTGLWFDLFVAMCNHLDDIEKLVGSPR